MCDMTEYTHQTAPTQFVEANGIRFAYRRFGKAGGVPIVFNLHYMGTMDYWDPAVTDGLARGPLQSLRGGPGGGKGVPEAQAPSSGGARSRGERQGFARPD